MQHRFFALISRMRYIGRWGLMRNTFEENIQEHSHQVAVLAHALAVIRNRCFGGCVDEGAVAVAALYHDAPEILTGDLPTPIKYYNPQIRDSYKQVEYVAEDKLLRMLPRELQGDYEEVLRPSDEQVQELVKAADKLSAHIKCLEELRSGNSEFSKAKKSIEADLRSRHMPEVEYFFENFIPSFSLTLDELEGF